MSNSTLYSVQWRGVTKGPWNLAGIKSALNSGEINSMYQVQVEGRWLLLREFLESQDSRGAEDARVEAQLAAQQAAHAASVAAEAARERESYQARLADLEESLRQAQQAPPPPPPPQMNPYMQPMMMMAPPAAGPPPARVGSLGGLIFFSLLLPVLGLFLSIICFCGNETDRKNGAPVLLVSITAAIIYFFLFAEYAST